MGLSWRKDIEKCILVELGHKFIAKNVIKVTQVLKDLRLELGVTGTQNQLGWKRTLRSWSLTYDLTHPWKLDRGPEYHIQSFLTVLCVIQTDFNL